MWKVIFTGAVCLGLALACGALGLLFYRDTPWVSATFAAVDAGIVFGGLKTVLDTTKTANELRKMTLDIRKLEMEINEKKHAAEKADAQVVVATLEEIKQYATPVLSQKRSSSTRIATIMTSIVMVVAIGTSVSVMNRLEHPSANESTPPAVKSAPSPPPFQEAPREAEGHYEQALKLYTEGEYCEALAEINEAIKIAPSNEEYSQFRRRVTRGCDTSPR
jgi:TolA-binding protein